MLNYLDQCSPPFDPLWDRGNTSVRLNNILVGKAILGLPVSSANPLINIKLSWKPICLYTAKSKIGYFRRVSDPSFKGSSLVKSCMNWNVASQTSLYMKKLKESLEMFFPPGGSLESLTVKAVHGHHEAVISA